MEISVLIVDKFVPSRARASLPTSYLYFEPSPNDGSSKQSKFNLFVQILLDIRL